MNKSFTLYKRTFEAEKYPKGSPERARLNESGVTSEYMHSYKYQVVGEYCSSCYRTKRDALEAIRSMSAEPIAV